MICLVAMTTTSLLEAHSIAWTSRLPLCSVVFCCVLLCSVVFCWCCLQQYDRLPCFPFSHTHSLLHTTRAKHRVEHAQLSLCTGSHPHTIHFWKVAENRHQNCRCLLAKQGTKLIEERRHTSTSASVPAWTRVVTAAVMRSPWRSWRALNSKKRSTVPLSSCSWQKCWTARATLRRPKTSSSRRLTGLGDKAALCNADPLLPMCRETE